MKVRELMGRTVRCVGPNDSLAAAAAIMGKRDIGIVPVVEDGRLIGVLTDRDIAVRGVADHVRSRASVTGIMTRKVSTCSPDEEIDVVLEEMARQQIRRMPVCDADEKLVGMFSLGDAAQTEEYQEAASRALSNISRPHGHHSQHLRVA